MDTPGALSDEYYQPYASVRADVRVSQYRAHSLPKALLLQLEPVDRRVLGTPPSKQIRPQLPYCDHKS